MAYIYLFHCCLNNFCQIFFLPDAIFYGNVTRFTAIQTIATESVPNAGSDASLIKVLLQEDRCSTVRVSHLAEQQSCKCRQWMRTAVDLYPNQTRVPLPPSSSRGSSEASGGGGPQLNGPESDVAFTDSGQAEWTDPWLPGSLCARGERRVSGFAAHQGRHAS